MNQSNDDELSSIKISNEELSRVEIRVSNFFLLLK